MQRLPIALALAVLQPQLDTAEPPPGSPEVVELLIHGCRPADVVIDETISGTRVWWLRDYMQSIARQVPGVVLSGAVERSRALAAGGVLGPWRVRGQAADLFFPSSDTRFCAAFEGLERVLLRTEEPTCDVIPPVSVPCLLRLREARAPTPSEQRRIDGESPD